MASSEANDPQAENMRYFPKEFSKLKIKETNLTLSHRTKNAQDTGLLLVRRPLEQEDWPLRREDWPLGQEDWPLGREDWKEQRRPGTTPAAGWAPLCGFRERDAR